MGILLLTLQSLVPIDTSSGQHTKPVPAGCAGCQCHSRHQHDEAVKMLFVSLSEDDGIVGNSLLLNP